MEKIIGHLGALFARMVANADAPGERWKNIPLGREAFGLMRGLPESVAGEFDTPADKAGILGRMLDLMEETFTPRFCMQVREYMLVLDPGDEDNRAQLALLRDYTDLSLPMEEFCRKYRRLLKFDPAERTEEMEAVVESVEREAADELAGIPRGMGFCFAYWHAREAALHRRGIEWRSPAAMNPGVIFD